MLRNQMGHNGGPPLLFREDAPQLALNFLVNSRAYVEREVYTARYPDLQWRELVPITNEAPDWTRVIEFYSQDSVGKAAWFHAGAHDVPRADVRRDRYTSRVHMAAIGYGYTLEEIAIAMNDGSRLDASRAEAARRAAEDFGNRVAFLGDSSVGFTGLVNSPAVTATTAPADGSGSSTTWASKTTDQIVRDFNSQITGIYTQSNTVENADTVLVPLTVWTMLAGRQYSSTYPGTLLQFLQNSNAYTAATGRPITIRTVLGLDTAGAGGISRAVFYRRSMDAVRMHEPMPFRFLAPWQVGPMLFEVPGIFRLGGVDVRLPGSMRYLDGV